MLPSFKNNINVVDFLFFFVVNYLHDVSPHAKFISLSMTMPITCAISYLITYVPIGPFSKELSLSYKMKTKMVQKNSRKGSQRC
jgi:cellulose synthase/poly-beta-1,6-N-acetylglucosamine synthase-like glycosyltransferase